MKKHIILPVIFFLLFGSLFAQVNPQDVKKKSKHAFEDLEDAELEYEEGKLRIWFIDAVTGMPIEGAAVGIDKVGKFISNARGAVEFEIPDDGVYIVSFRKNKYIPADFTIEIEAGTIFSNNRFSVSPEMNLEYVRIVLDWGKNPKDLDLHFVKENVYHISYQDMRTASDGSAMLDRDDRSSYGPETITVRKIDNNSVYHCFVFDYSNRNKENSDKLAKSKATVRVYGNGRLLHTFTVPTDLHTNRWNVFSIMGGKIINNGTIGSVE
ncbi:MAG: hypothetical protein Kow00108_03580 [Calditrichia bacterium]